VQTHHHRFYRPFFHAGSGWTLGRFPLIKPIHSILSCAHSALRCELPQVLSDTLTHVFLLRTAPLLWSCNLNASASRHPIVTAFSFKMSKPPHSIPPHNICHALHTQLPIQLLTFLVVFLILFSTTLSVSLVVYYISILSTFMRLSVSSAFYQLIFGCKNSKTNS